MVCPECGEHFKVFEVALKLKLLHNVDYNDIPEQLCYNCSLAYVEENSVTLFEGSEYDIDDPESHY